MDSQMDAKGSYIIQADRGSTASINVSHYYNLSAPQEIDPEVIENGQKRLAELPLDTIPEVAAVPHGSCLVHAHNPLFVGREQDLKELARMLKGSQTTAIGQIAAATGLGGIGKTQFASEFSHRYGQYFAGGVYWLNFADPEAVPAEVAACGRPDEGQFKIETQIRLVLSAWQSGLPRLLVFDNCEDEALLDKWRPKTGASRVLVTSRRQNWDPSIGVKKLALGVLERNESINLLRKHATHLSENKASAIAEELGNLPLALHLAGSFLRRYRDEVSPNAYLKQLQNRSLLDHPSLKGRGELLSPTQHDLHVFRTFALSFDRLNELEKIDRLALSLLARAARFLPGAPIPKELLLKTLQTKINIDPLDIKDGILRLVDVGLIEPEAEGTFVLHRLLSLFVEGVCKDDDAQSDVETAVLKEAKCINDSGFPARLIMWQTHLRFFADQAMQREDEAGINLYYTFGLHLISIGDYRKASPYIKKALEVSAKVLGEEHLNTASAMNGMGLLLQNMGDYQAAWSYYEKALAIHLKVLGEEHPLTAVCFTSLANLLMVLGNNKAALPYLKKSFDINKKILGEEHPRTTISMNNIGFLLASVGAYQAARPYYEKALELSKKLLGEEHPDTARSYNNMGYLLQSMGEYQAARPHYEKALELRKKLLGEEHPDTAGSYNNMGYLLRSIGDYAVAHPYYEKALEINRKVLGEEHLDTAVSLNNLGFLLQAMGKYKAARPYYEKALKIYKKRLGEEHSTTKLIQNNLDILP